MTSAAGQTALFPHLSPADIDSLCVHGTEQTLTTGERLFSQDEPATNLFIILEGQIKISKHIGEQEVVLAIHEAGGFSGALSLLTGDGYTADGYALSPTRVLIVSAAAFRHALAADVPGAQVVLAAMARRVASTEQIAQQSEKLAALGKLSAGLAHELNNPAAAAHRAAAQLQGSLDALFAATPGGAAGGGGDPLPAIIAAARRQARSTSHLTPLQKGDAEDALGTWLDDHGVTAAWDLAPTLVEAGLDPAWLDGVAAQIAAPALDRTVTWLGQALTVCSLIGTIESSTGRISDLVKAIKAYTYMDQAPVQEMDIHDGIENTLLILGHKLRPFTVERDYDRSLPRLCAHGSELNQVWTNLIDNALDAMGATGTLRLRTAREGADGLLVEIGDNGPGIPAAIQARIFEPFFTTKGVGVGTGLGLDIAYRIVVQTHHGDIRLLSEPGNTRFQVRLPLTG